MPQRPDRRSRPVRLLVVGLVALALACDAADEGPTRDAAGVVADDGGAAAAEDGEATAGDRVEDAAARVRPATPPAFVGSATCAGCHAEQAERFRGSHHDRAMEVASPDAVEGRFDGSGVTGGDESWRFVREDARFVAVLERPGREAERMTVAYTFGVAPLQQLLVERGRGRFQVLPIAWDARPADEGGQRWFDLQGEETIAADDPLHWEGLAYNWNSQCAACHSTRLEKGYDAESDAFATRWAEIDVGCEACHGAGSDHVARREQVGEGVAIGEGELEVAFERWDPGVWKRSEGARIASRVRPRQEDVQLDVCAPCHARRAQLVDVVRIGSPFLDGHRPAFLEPDLYFEDGQIRDEVYVWGSFVQSRMYAAGVRCNDCHDPHALGLRREGNALCSGCHDPGAYDGSLHHGHEATSAGAACVACHMPDRVYMEIDARRDHSFPQPRPARQAALGAPVVCGDCHGDRDAGWAEAAIAGWRGPDRDPPTHWSDALLEGSRLRGEPERWLEIALGDAAPPFIRASAWVRFVREADDVAIGARLEAIEERLRAGSELERLALAEVARRLTPRVRASLLPALVDVARRLAPPVRASLLPALLDDDRRAIRVAAAEAALDVPARAWRPRDLAVLGRALREHRARLVANAERPEAGVGLGMLALVSGEPEAARDAFERVIERSPSFVPAYVNLADLERMLGRADASVARLREAAALAPDEATVHYALGLALHRAGESPESLVALDRAVDLAPDDRRIVLARALALDAAGRRGDAIEALAVAVDRGMRGGDVELTLVTLLRDQGEIDRARARASAWAESSPTDRRAQMLLRELAAPR